MERKDLRAQILGLVGQGPFLSTEPFGTSLAEASMAQDNCRCRFDVPTLDSGVDAWRDQHRLVVHTQVCFAGCGPNGRI